MHDQEDNISPEEHENLSAEVNESLGMPEGEHSESMSPVKDTADELPAFAKERLGRQEKRHKRELRELRQQMQQLMQTQNACMANNNAYSPQPNPQGNGEMDDQIQRAVAAALRAKEDQERQGKEAEKAAHVHKQYQNLQDHLDSAADKYDDFDEVVRGDNVPFTSAMRDAALLLDNPGDVLYKLGKNKPELERIAKLHPLDQAREMVKLSTALMSGSGKQGSAPRTIGQIKNSPVPSPGINDNTPAAEIRARMKSGNWK